MQVLLAPDKFKGSLSAQGVCQALTRGLLKTNPDLSIISRPLADGGDGSLEILGHYFELETFECTVQDPLGRLISASYKKTANTAYIEMSKASGLVLLSSEERNCMKTTSFGTGELILDAINKGVQEIYLFIGGSATNDGGMGVAEALGYQFFDSSGKRLAPIGENLIKVDKIDNSQLKVDLNEVSIHVVCDVNNPFSGKNGAAFVYAAQKGASEEEIIFLDKGLAHLAEKLTHHGFPDINEIPGAGAAGGIGGGSIAFLGAKLISGIQMFLNISELDSFIKNTDLIITGEGKLDGQTEQGKVVSGVCELARKNDVPVIAVCGAAEDGLAKKLGLKDVFTVLSYSSSIEEAMTKTAEKLEEIGRGIVPTY